MSLLLLMHLNVHSRCLTAIADDWKAASSLKSPGLSLVFSSTPSRLLSIQFQFLLRFSTHPITVSVFFDTVSGALTTMGKSLTFIFHIFLSSFKRSWYFSRLLHFWSTDTARLTIIIHIFPVSLLLVRASKS